MNFSLKFHFYHCLNTGTYHTPGPRNLNIRTIEILNIDYHEQKQVESIFIKAQVLKVKSISTL